MNIYHYSRVEIHLLHPTTLNQKQKSKQKVVSTDQFRIHSLPVAATKAGWNTFFFPDIGILVFS